MCSPGTRPMSADTALPAAGEGRSWLLAGKGGDARRILHCQGHPHTPANATALQWRRSPPVGGEPGSRWGWTGTSTVLRSRFSLACHASAPPPPPPPTCFCTWREAAPSRAPAAARPPQQPRSPSPGSRPELPKRRKEDEGLIAGGGGGGEQWEGGRGGRTGPGEGAGSRASVRLELGHGRWFPAPSPDPWGGPSARIPARIPRSATRGSTCDPPPPTCGVVALGE